MKKRMLGLLLVLALLAAALCTTVFAAGGTAYYVSSSGNDTNDGKSTDAPFATLAKAVEEAEDGSTIYVMSDLTMTKCARFYDKSLTITSLGDTAHTISRGDDFAQQQDNARSTYNPAMIEVQTTSKGAGLTLTNIILDDTFSHEGTVFAQASSDYPEYSEFFVQDAMIASNAYVDTTITLGDGAVLQNFGGMSAVRVTDKATLVMKSGSVIKDTDSHTTRERAPSMVAGADKQVGPAGAVWIQGASFEMEAGATIRNVDGRAVYVDGGSATIGGTISGIKANSQMWQGNGGVAIHLRNKATGTLLQGGVIEGISGNGAYMVYVNGKDSSFEMKNGSYIKNGTALAINAENEATVTVNGTITDNSGKGNPFIRFVGRSNLTLGASGIIQNNITDNIGLMYIHSGSTAHLYGKIQDNTAPAGAVYVVTNGNSSHVYMYDGAEITGNTSSGSYGVIEVQQGECSFTMNGGLISGNKAKAGAVQVRKGSAKFVMNAGSIVDNELLTGGTGDAGVYLNGKEGSKTVTAELNGGTLQSITVDSDVITTSTKGHVYISDDFVLQSGYVAMRQDSKTVTPADNSFDIKLGNASKRANGDLSDASSARGWNAPLATFWAQRDGAATLTVGVSGADAKLPVYALMLHTDSDGATYGDDQIVAATKNANGTFTFTIPADYKEAGCAVALVQPTEYYGDLVITADKTTLTYDEAAETYTITYTETFTLSENLKSQLLNKELGVYMNEAKITLLPDLRLPMDIPMYTFESSIFECKTITGTTGGGKNSFTANCVLKEGWEAHLSEPTVLTVIAVLDKVDFEAGDMLATTGEVVINPESGIEFTPNGDAAVAAYAANINPPPEVAPFSNVYIPGNVCTTLMLAQEDEGGEDEPNQPTGGFFFPMGEEHLAYVSGYPDGTVRPEANITRAESAAMLYRLMPRGYFASGAQTPADVTTSDWYYSIVSQMVGSGYLTGYADGTFRGNNNVTRAEFVTMLVRLSGARGGWCSFTDVSASHWAYDAISTAAAEGWIGGYADGSFRPDQAITRAEAMTIINRALGRGVDETSWLDDYIRWPDTPRNAWYYYEVIEATNDHYYTGSRPNEDWVG